MLCQHGLFIHSYFETWLIHMCVTYEFRHDAFQFAMFEANTPWKVS